MKTDYRKYNPRCCYCGKFAGYLADQYTPFGCANPEEPEPYDPEYICKKCEKTDYKKWMKEFQRTNGYLYGNWCKSNGERKAAAKMNLVWVHEPSYVDPKTGFDYFNVWVNKDKIKSMIPYLEYHKELRMIKSLRQHENIPQQ